MGVIDPNEGVAMSLATGRETKAHCQAAVVSYGLRLWQCRTALPRAGNIVPQTAEAVEEDAEGAPGVGNIVPRNVEETDKKNESAACVSIVGNEVPRGVKRTSTRAEVSLSTSRVDNQVPRSESETPPSRRRSKTSIMSSTACPAVKLGQTLPEVSALLNLEELSRKDFLDELKAGEISF
ncbi:Pol protein [Phytophthora palmivora]|uniref:Pol protein n=1 Tax=Phytophthora palmivora TaxID=4796 RepID=A0A2P4XIZ1_9STRA|nr:Pol protein [Phytophthora palmivora]